MAIIRPLILFIFLSFHLPGFSQWKAIEFDMFTNNNVHSMEANIIGFDTLAVNILYELNVSPWSLHMKTYLSTDNGDSWDSVFTERWCYFITVNKLYSTRNDSLFYTTNAGNTWIYKSSILEYAELKVIDESTIAVYTKDQALISDNYGSSWDTIQLPNYIYSSVPEIANFYPKSKDHIKAVISRNSENVPAYYIETTNGGASWDTTKIVGSSYFDGYHNKVYNAYDSMLFYTGNRELLSSLKDDISWDTTSFFSRKKDVWASPNLISFYENIVIVACTSSTEPDSTLAISHDFGKTWKWQKIANGTHYSFGYLEGLSLYSNNYGVAYGPYRFLYLLDGRCAQRPRFTYSINNNTITTMNQSPTTANYSWYWGDGSSTDGYDAFHDYGVADDFNLCLTGSDSTTYCYSDSCIIVPIGDCNALFTYVKDTSATYTIVLIDSSSGSNLDYTWYWGDGDSSTVSQPTHDYATFGEFLVRLKVETGNCISIYSDSLGMDSLGNLLKKDGFTVVVGKQASIADLAASSILVYPNPSTEKIKISIDRGEIQDISILSLEGREMHYSLFEAGSQQWILNTQGLSGIYVLRVRTDLGYFYKKIEMRSN